MEMRDDQRDDERLLDRKDKNVYTMTPEEKAKKGAAVAATVLMRKEKIGYAQIPKDSIYGAAVAMPQVARSSGWAYTYIGLVARVYLFMGITMFTQLFLITMVKEECNIMNTYGGQMHLCDFGRGIENCPDGPNCIGPGGTHYSFPRLYSYGSWSTRIFVRDALLGLFPEKKDDIKTLADPGEWGVENHWCRLICVFLFMMSVVDDLKGATAMVNLMTNTPNRPDMWISYDVPSWGDKHYVKEVKDWQELDLVKFKIAALPLKWKVISSLTVILPKFFVWFSLVTAGVHFLMETSGILDMIINSVAMSFILQLDTVTLELLATEATKHIMESLEDVRLYPIEDIEHEDEDQVQEVLKQELGTFHRNPHFLHLLFPKRLLMISVLTFVFVYRYYMMNCIQQEDGSWISKPMQSFPDTMPMPYWKILLGIENPNSGEYWSMPSEGS